MKRTILVTLALAALAAPSAGTAAPLGANGGGRGTVDGVTPFSQFGFGVTIAPDGAVHGHFNCLMAGATQFSLGGLTWKLMAVRGEVTNVIAMTETSATFEGVGVFIQHFDDNEHSKDPQRFRVTVTEGGPGVGTLQLTLIPDPGIPFLLPLERVLNGRITVS